MKLLKKVDLDNKQKEILMEANFDLYLLLEAEEIQGDGEPHPDEPQADIGQGKQDDDQTQQGQEQEVQPDPEQIFQAELEGTEDKFIQFVLYDKLRELDSKLEILISTLNNNISIDSDVLLTSLEQFKQYVGVLNELIFSVSSNTIYNILGQIELELVEILNIYYQNMSTKGNINVVQSQ